MPAEQNGGPDSLSRLPTYEDEPNAAEESEEFLDRKILKVRSQEEKRNVQIATITFEDVKQRRSGRWRDRRRTSRSFDGRIARSRNRTESTSDEDGMGYIQGHHRNTREGRPIPATKRRSRFQGHDQIQRDRRTSTRRVTSKKNSIHRRHVRDRGPKTVQDTDAKKQQNRRSKRYHTNIMYSSLLEERSYHSIAQSQFTHWK